MWLPHWHGAAHAWEARGTSEISQGVKWLSGYPSYARSKLYVIRTFQGTFILHVGLKDYTPYAGG